MRILCSHVGCTRDNTTIDFHKGMTLCKPHYQQYRRYGKTKDLYGHRQSLVCYVENCGKPTSSMNLCKTHYQASKNRLAEPGERMCAVSGCGRLHEARGLCQKHYVIVNTAERNRRSDLDKCEFPDCVLPQDAKGYCSSHYKAFYYAIESEKLIHLDGKYLIRKEKV